MTARQLGSPELLLEEISNRWSDDREAGVVRYEESQGLWQVLDYATVAAVLADPLTYSSDLSSLAPTQEDFEVFRQGNFVGMDPPHHRRLRALVSQAFTPRVVQGLAPRIEALCARLLDAVADQDRFDLVDALAYPLPIIVIAELLGVAGRRAPALPGLGERPVQRRPARRSTRHGGPVTGVGGHRPHRP